MKKVNLNLMSKTDIKISESQIDWFFKKIKKINHLEFELKTLKLEINPNIFTYSLLEKEALDSSKIEGSKTIFDEMFYNISEGINDVFSWEIRNLINLYQYSFFSFKEELIDFSIDDLKFLHKKLYLNELKDFSINFNPKTIIEIKKPGKIITDDNKPNWIGTKYEKTLELIKPSKKIEYLKDALNEIRKNKNMKEGILNSIRSLIKFHPFFEAIHPFSDGNGRVGRLLLINLFSYFGFTNYNWIFISDFWNKNRKEYINELNYVVTTNKWNDWTFFFFRSFFDTVDNACEKTHKIINIYKKYNKIFNKYSEKEILKFFIKYPILNKTIFMNYFIKEKKISKSTAYRSFDKIIKIIPIIEKNKNYYFKELLEIIKS